jgi:DNA-binding PadR family transcriptional regulator
MVLGLLRMAGPLHGYEVRRELLSWGSAEWANVQPGSIYHALRKMAEEGLLTEAGTEQVGARPARITYEITAKGEAEFQTLLRSYWWRTESSKDPFLAAFSFVPELPREEAVAALRTRAKQLRSTADGLRASMESGWIRRSKPAHVSWMFELWIARSEGEIAWCERVADLIESGVSYLPDECEPGEAGGDRRSSNNQA